MIQNKCGDVEDPDASHLLVGLVCVDVGRAGMIS